MSPEPGQAPGKAGRLVFVVGPSGAGKDTLLNAARAALAGDGAVLFPRRVVTRVDGGIEDHDVMTAAAFEAAERAGAFTLSWRAHGLGYGLPASVGEALAAGRTVVCNVSRAIIAPARAKGLPVQVVHITAPADVLARRLAARGRETEADIRQRLARAAEGVDLGPVALEIVNTGTAEEGAARLVAFLRGSPIALESASARAASGA